MGKQDNHQAKNNSSPELADLPATDEQAEQAKGGLNYTKIHFDYIPQKADEEL